MAAASLLLVACAPNLGAATSGWTPVAASEGMVYVVTRDGQVKALADSGFEGVRLAWTFSGPDDSVQGAYHSPVVGENLVYASAIDGFLYAIEKGSGTLGTTGWRQPRARDAGLKPLVGGPALDPGLGIVVVGSEDHNLYAYDAQTGQEQWRFSTGDKIWTTPVIHDGTVYFGSHDHNVYAVDAATGEEKWRFATGAAVVARPLVWRDMVIIGSFDRKLYALNVENGEELWEFEGRNWFWAGAVANDTTIFAPSMDGNVYALDRGGNLLWEHSMGSAIVSSPALVPRGLVVASKEGRVGLLDSSGGDIGLEREISFLSIKPSEVKSPLYSPPVGQDTPSGEPGAQGGPGTQQEESVFVGDLDGNVRRIQVKSGQIEVWCFNTENDQTCN